MFRLIRTELGVSYCKRRQQAGLRTWPKRHNEVPWQFVALRGLKTFYDVHISIELW
jgi:hypothetical protein